MICIYVHLQSSVCWQLAVLRSSISLRFAIHRPLFQTTQRTFLFSELRPKSFISCTDCRILVFLSLLILKLFISQDSCKVSLQGFCLFDLYFYTLKSQSRYPSLIPSLTLHYQTGLTLHLSGLGWIPAQVMEALGQSCQATHQPNPRETLHPEPLPAARARSTLHPLNF